MRLIFVAAILLVQALVTLADTELTYVSADGAYTLNFWDKDSGVDQETIDGLINTYFTVYPKEVDEYGGAGGAPTENWLIIDPELSEDTPAETGDGQITCSADYFKNNPADLDVITHEAMHIVQASTSGPGWLVEGIADYVRNQFGVNNDEQGWSLPGYKSGQKYTDGYGVTASFLVYVEKKSPGFVKQTVSLMRNGDYTDAQWQAFTGSSLSALWTAYTKAPPPPPTTRLTYVSGSNTLQFLDKASGVSQATINNLVNTYFTVYPKEVAAYNTGSPTENWLIIDPALTGNPASTGDGKMTCSASYFKSNPNDWDVITHEAMHIVQASTSGPGWLVEGIADYVRNQFGVNNAAVGWSLPGYKAGQKYTDGYKVTAGFLVYVEGKKPGFVKKMQAAMRAGSYSDSLWSTWGGSSLTTLWNNYAAAAGK